MEAQEAWEWMDGVLRKIRQRRRAKLRAKEIRPEAERVRLPIICKTTWMGSGMSWQPGVSLSDVEQSVIRKAMDFYHGNKNFVADALGISLRSLYNKINEYKIDCSKYKFKEEPPDVTQEVLRTGD